MWRVVWVGGVFALFAVVVWSAFDRAPRPGEAVPVVRADPAPFKELVDLPPVDATMPGSTVLNLLAEGDDRIPSGEAGGLDRALAEEAARLDAIARMEEALTATETGETIASMDAVDAVDAVDDDLDEPSLRSGEAMATEPPAVPMHSAALVDRGFRIQLAAVKPGEEMSTYAQLERRFPVVLAGLAPRFQAISTASGVLVRVQAGPLESQGDAEARCRSMRDAGGDCFVVAISG